MVAPTTGGERRRIDRPGAWALLGVASFLEPHVDEQPVRQREHGGEHDNDRRRQRSNSTMMMMSRMRPTPPPM